MAFRHYFILALLIIANLALAGYLINNRYASKATAGFVSPEKSNKLPLLELQTDTGQEINTGNLVGSALFIQFVNPHVDEQIKSITRVYENRPRGAVSWLMITKDARKLRAQLSNSINEALIVENGYEDLRKAFNIPDCCEKWVMFDSSGEFKDSGYYNQDDTPARLRRLVDGEQALSPEALKAAINSIKSGQLAQLRAKTMRSPSGKAVIVMFSSVCAACPTGQLVSLLNTHAKLDKNIEYLALLPNTFTPSDINNFRINMDIPFPVKRADRELSRQWLSLIQQYGEHTVNGAVIVLNKGEMSAVQGLQETKRHLMSLASQ